MKQRKDLICNNTQICCDKVVKKETNHHLYTITISLFLKHLHLNIQRHSDILIAFDNMIAYMNKSSLIYKKTSAVWHAVILTDQDCICNHTHWAAAPHTVLYLCM